MRTPFVKLIESSQGFEINFDRAYRMLQCKHAIHQGNHDDFR